MAYSAAGQMARCSGGACFAMPAAPAGGLAPAQPQAAIQAAAAPAGQPGSPAGLVAAGAAAGAAAAVAASGRRSRRRGGAKRGKVSLNAVSFYDQEGSKMTFELDGIPFEMDENKVLGVGAQGKVHVGKRLDTGETVAIKHMPVKHLILDQAGADKMALIDQEIAVLKSVGQHPNIAGCVAGGSVYRRGTSDYPQAKMLCMELVQGRELAEAVAMDGPMSEKVAQHIFVEVLNGLAHMHSQGVLHRDLKLQNILVTGDKVSETSEVKLIDFGVAKDMGSDVFETVVGTLEIMPPEMAKAKICYMPDKSSARTIVANFKSPQEANPGFGFVQRTPEGFGARLTGVDPNGAAGSQGIENDWILLKINDIDVETMLFQMNPDDASHTKVPKIVNTLMELSSDFTITAMESPPRKFTAKADTWAAGVVLYTCLTGKVPFAKELDIIEGDYNKAPIAGCSKEAQELIDQLLQKEPEKRLALSQALVNPWVACARGDNCTVPDSFPTETGTGQVKTKVVAKVAAPVRAKLGEPGSSGTYGVSSANSTAASAPAPARRQRQRQRR
ncbi:unnamed protein product, partial [Prorocentrum cordatum]